MKSPHEMSRTERYEYLLRFLDEAEFYLKFYRERSEQAFRTEKEMVEYQTASEKWKLEAQRLKPIVQGAQP